ncbi:hypothetical protein JST97_23895 [bacterium]|nr:hypothetical protein [bacterium]
MGKRFTARESWQLLQAGFATGLCSIYFLLQFVNPDASQPWRAEHPYLSWTIDHDFQVWTVLAVIFFLLTFGVQALVAKAWPKGVGGWVLQSVVVAMLAGLAFYLTPSIPSKGLFP